MEKHSELEEYSDNLSLANYNKCCFQHDLVPPHNTRTVCVDLHQRFRQRWTGNGGIPKWAARSHDLTVMGIFLWSILKTRVIMWGARVCNRKKHETISLHNLWTTQNIQKFFSFRRLEINFKIETLSTFDCDYNKFLSTVIANVFRPWNSSHDFRTSVRMIKITGKRGIQCIVDLIYLQNTRLHRTKNRTYHSTEHITV